MTIPPIPPSRLACANTRPERPDGDFVLYWMIAARRVRWTFGLQHALFRARQLDKPLLVLEPLRSGYRWASDRLHDFVLRGMLDNAARLEEAGVRYYAYVEPSNGNGRGLLETLAGRACVVVTDEFPCFFLPRMVAAAARRIPVRLETVDGNGLLPLRATRASSPTAYAFRRFLQRSLLPHLADAPLSDPLEAATDRRRAVVPREILDRWTPFLVREPGSIASVLADLPIDHDVLAVPGTGGSVKGEAELRGFVKSRLARYGDERNQPEAHATSRLSPYLHFGHVSVHMAFDAVADRESWTPDRVAAKTNGSREGFWGMSAEAESFLDELITWRELGYVFCHHHPRTYDQFESLPDWARTTLEKHAPDERSRVYDRAELEAARTHDALWNAAQRELVESGVIHNYLRMLWGKKILEWTKSPRRALEIMIELNNKYALDGRDPNSYSGIFWVLGRFDRPWGPERPIFGTIRYMSSENTARKVRVRSYVERYLGPSRS